MSIRLDCRLTVHLPFFGSQVAGFYINLPIGAVSGLLLFFTHVPDETLKPPFSFALLQSIVPNLDLTGFALFAPTTVMFLLALEWGSSQYGWSSPIVIGLFAGSGAMLIVFCLWEWHVGERALIPFHVVKRRVVWASTIQTTSLFVNNFVGVNYVPIYFQAVRGVGPSLSGVYTLPSILTQLLSLVATGALGKSCPPVPSIPNTTWHYLGSQSRWGGGVVAMLTRIYYSGKTWLLYPVQHSCWCNNCRCVRSDINLESGYFNSRLDRIPNTFRFARDGATNGKSFPLLANHPSHSAIYTGCIDSC